MRASACMPRRRWLRGRGRRRQAVDSCRRTRRWHLTWHGEEKEFLDSATDTDTGWWWWWCWGSGSDAGLGLICMLLGASSIWNVFAQARSAAHFWNAWNSQCDICFPFSPSLSVSLSLLAWQEVSWHRKSGSTGVCQFYGMCYKQLVEVLLTASAAVSQQFPAKNLNWHRDKRQSERRKSEGEKRREREEKSEQKVWIKSLNASLGSLVCLLTVSLPLPLHSLLCPPFATIHPWFSFIHDSQLPFTGCKDELPDHAWDMDMFEAKL